MSKSKKDKEYSDDRDEKDEKLRDAAIGGASGDTVQRYGSAVKEQYVAYSGVDYETGEKYSRSLKDVANYKVDPNNPKKSYQQQAGFSAEIKEQAYRNAENEINGSSNRAKRTDDMGNSKDPRYSDYSSNDPYVDLVMIDKNGNVIPGSEEQLKYVGDSPESCYKKVMSKKYRKYFEHGDLYMVIPKDYYKEVLKEADKNIEKLQKQLERAEQEGNEELAQEIREKIAYIEYVKEHLRQGRLTKKQAELAREHPKLMTAIDVGEYAIRSGLQAGVIGAGIGGTVSIVRNAVAYAEGEIDESDFAKNVVHDTVDSGFTGFATGSTGAVVKGTMQQFHSNNTTLDKGIQKLSHTSFPATFAAVTVNNVKVMKRFVCGEIDGTQCLEELGCNGVSEISSAMFATVGDLVMRKAIPTTIHGLSIGGMIGGMVGGMIGYSLAAASYQALVESSKRKKMAHEERLAVEAECRAQIALMQEYRHWIETHVMAQYVDFQTMLNQSFDQIKVSLAIGDADGVISGANNITRAFGEEPQYENMDEFRALMNSNTPLEL